MQDPEVQNLSFPLLSNWGNQERICSQKYRKNGNIDKILYDIVDALDID
jgi:hypothetical protein